jgi:hypothetical protein
MTGDGVTARAAPPSRGASALAWSLLAITVVGAVVGQILERATDSLDGSLAEEMALLVAFMAFPVVGALIASRHPRNAVGWLLLGVGFLTAALVVGSGYTRYGLVLHPDWNLPATTLGAWIENWAWLPLLSTITTLLLLLFPTGRPPSRRWRPVAWISGAHISLITVLSMLEDKLRGHGFSIDNPIGINGLGDVEKMSLLLLPLFPLVLLCASSLIFRYRRASFEERQQLKWVAVAAFLFAVGTTVGEILQLPTILFPLFLGALPASIAVAMLKYRLYDIDLIINRTLVYGALTALLGATYLGLVVVLQGAIPAADDSDLTIAGSTLAVAALFLPLRGRVQSFIDRRFYRHKYDAAKTLYDFTQRLRDEIDLQTLTHELVAVVDRTMEPRHVSLLLLHSSPQPQRSGGLG